jgi:hypothetical protein
MIRESSFFIAVALLVAGVAIAAEPRAYRDPASAPTLSMPTAPRSAQTTLQCWVGVPDNSYVQEELYRYGVAWQLPAGTVMSRIGFWYSGWQDTHGPYPYDLELWDVAACERLRTKTGLWAPDAFDGPAYCEVDLCGEHFGGGGELAILVRPLMARSGTMWPMLLTESTGEQGCVSYFNRLDPTIPPPWQQTACNRSTGVNFLFSLNVNECPVPVTRSSWGSLKAHYR